MKRPPRMFQAETCTADDRNYISTTLTALVASWFFVLLKFLWSHLAVRVRFHTGYRVPKSDTWTFFNLLKMSIRFEKPADSLASPLAGSLNL